MYGSLLIAVLVSGCTTHRADVDAAPATRRTPPGSLHRLDGADVASSVGSAYEVVRNLRPLWLAGRGSSGTLSQVRVYIDNAHAGGPDELKRLPAAQVAELTYLSAREATLRFGEGHGAGAILVRTGVAARP